MAGNPLISAYFFIIRTSVVAHYGQSKALELIHTRTPRVAVAISLSLTFGLAEKESLASYGNPAGAMQTRQCDGIDGLRAMDILIGQYVC